MVEMFQAELFKSSTDVGWSYQVDYFDEFDARVESQQKNDCRPQTVDRRPQTADRRPQTVDRRPQTVDRRP